ncbi:MAG TPA: SUMF1/EgtB/PvdO family nonheme iron enzyme [Mycobacteriales bacterium]|nr:SUMF1/EgtB/PvdO family nonheme iron enzyme [Mycobacteriales bacterium]
MRRRWAAALTFGLALAAFNGLAVAAAHRAPPLERVHYDWIRIGDPGNPPDTTVMASDRTTGYGSVAYPYRIGKYDVTNTQYAAFLNAVASTADPHLLFFPCMNRSQCYHEGSGIARTGGPGHYHYVVQPGRGQMPVNYVNLFSAMRFANWMNNGQGDASTEHGAYQLDGNGIIPTNLLEIRRTPGAKVFLPSENEWYKAAYWDPRKQRYYAYPAGSDRPMTCALPTAMPNTGNCGLVTAYANPANPGIRGVAAWIWNDETPVGAYSGSPSPNGTYDQGGDVFQWTEDFTDAVIDQYQAGAAVAPLTDALDSLIGSPFNPGFGPLAVVRGTDFGDAGSYNASSSRSCDIAADPFETYGFRLAATIPSNTKEQR